MASRTWYAGPTLPTPWLKTPRAVLQRNPGMSETVASIPGRVRRGGPDAGRVRVAKRQEAGTVTRRVRTGEDSPLVPSAPGRVLRPGHPGPVTAPGPRPSGAPGGERPGSFAPISKKTDSPPA